MNRNIFVWLSFFICLKSLAQLSGTITVPSSSYTSLAAAITAINQQGISGPLFVNVSTGYSELAPVGGYSLTASGTSQNPIIIQKNGSGSNPLIIAYSGGNGTPGSMNQDGIFRLIASDYVTIDGIDLLDTNSTHPASMEFGYGLFKSDPANGCWNTSIKNCVIRLNRQNNAGGSGPAADGSRGIDVVNAYTSAHNAVITVSASSGSHSNNSFQANRIENCNIPISLVGFNDAAPYSFADKDNQIGGTTIGLGNQLLNFGGGGTLSASAAIRTFGQYDLKISNNIINNNSGTGQNHQTTLRGIQLNTALGANAVISHNTITLNGGAVNSQLAVIENNSGSGGITNTVVIEHNIILNGTYSTAVSPTYYGILNTASVAVLSVSIIRL